MTSDDRPDVSPVSLWERLEQPIKAPRASLDHRQIAAAAVDLADAEGLEAVSMRKLGGRLGVAPMALYRYVTSKEEIFELMVEAVLGDGVVLSPQETDWREAARRHLRQIRTVILAHPWLIGVSTLIPIDLVPGRVRLAERGLASLDGLGLDVDTMHAVLSTVNSYAWGAVSAEVGLQRMLQARGWTAADDLRDAYSPHMRYIVGSGRYPTFSRYIHEGVRKDDDEWRFEFGLECVLDGIAARLGI